MRRAAVLLAVSLIAGLASAQDPPKQDPAKQDSADDRVPIPASIETWYRIEQNKQQIGWAHETLYTTTMRNYRYDYFYESDYQFTSGDEDNQVNEYFKAQLEEDFDIYDLEYTLTNNGVQHILGLKTYADTEERVVTLDIKKDPPVNRVFKFSTSETVHLYLNPMLYKLRQTGSLAQPTRLREKVLILSQEEPVSVSYTASAMGSREFLGKPVKVSEVRIEGWDRSPLALFSKTWVDKYGRIVEAETADRTTSFLMVKDQAAAQGARKGIIPKGRRDPFDKRGAMPGGPDGDRRKDQTDPTGKKKDPDIRNVEKAQYEAVLTESKNLITQLQDEVSKEFRDESRSTYLKILANYRGLYKHVETDPIRRTEVDRLKEDAERIYGGVKKLKDAIAGKLDRMNDLYLNDNLTEVEKELKELEGMRTAPELFRSEDGTAELEAAIRQAQKIRAQTQARIELGKKSLILTGTITATEVVQDVVKFDLFVAGSRLALSQPVSVRRLLTMAVINDEAYKEGDIVQREGVKILKIHRHAVEVEYKGEVRQVVLRK